MRPYLEKPFTKIGLMEWFKVNDLSSSFNNTEKNHNVKTTKTTLLSEQHKVE
jgi:hypothetical protein